MMGPYPFYNTRCHPYLEARQFTLGKFLNSDKEIRKHHSIIFKLEEIKAPENQIREELEVALRMMMKKLHKVRSCKIVIDKLKFFWHRIKGTLERFIILLSEGNY